MNAVNNNFLHAFSHPNDERRAFASFTRNVAVSTGNLDKDYVTEYTLTPGKLLFEQNAYVFTLNGWKYKKRRLNASKYGSNQPVFYDKESHLILGFIPIVTSNILYSSENTLEWDMAAGGYKDEFYDKEGLYVIPVGAVTILRTSANYWGQKYYDKHMNFLPTVSALAIKRSIWQNNNLFYNLKGNGLMFNEFDFTPNQDESDLYGYPHLAHPTNHFNITPFEAIYCDPQTYEHIKMQASVDADVLNDNYLVYLRDFILDEVEADVVGLQNKIIGKNHNQNIPNYKYRAWYKAYNRIDIGNLVTPKTDPGDFIIEATGDITVYAGQTISIKPGFHTQYGSDFHAYIDYLCGRPREGKSMGAEDEDEDENQMDSQFGSEMEEISQTEPLIFPNPNEGQINIKLPDAWVECDYQVFDLQGTLLQNGILRSANQQIELQLKKGIYIFRINKGNLIYTKKIIIL